MTDDVVPMPEGLSNSADMPADGGRLPADGGPVQGENSKHREPRPRVFGKFAFFITVVPMVFYLAGLAFAGYWESSRAHTQVKKQAMIARTFTDAFEQRLNAEFASSKSELEKARVKYNLIAIKDLLGGEDWTAEQLERIIGPILDKKLEPDYPEKLAAREQLAVLFKMKQFEEEHKNRDVLALSHRHFNELSESQFGAAFENVATDSATSQEWFPPDKTWYPTTYSMVIAGTAVLLMLAFPGYFKTPFKINWGLSLFVGVAGIVLWVGLIELDRRFLHIGTMLSPHGRDAFNPFEELKSNPTWMWQFMAIRFTGLVLIVPFIEEFFLRGWLMRYIDSPDWDEVPIGDAGQLAIIGVVGYGILSHIGEPLAAAAWFGLVTWLYLKTKSIWDCVVAHAVTNLLLGLFVCWSGSWYLW